MKKSRLDEEIKVIGKYRFADVLGKGGFGTVFRAFNEENGATYVFIF